MFLSDRVVKLIDFEQTMLHKHSPIRCLLRLGTVNVKYSRIPVIRTPNYANRLGPLGKFVDNSTTLTCLEITGYRIKYNTVLWLLEIQIRRIRQV